MYTQIFDCPFCLQKYKLNEFDSIEQYCSRCDISLEIFEYKYSLIFQIWTDKFLYQYHLNDDKSTISLSYNYGPSHEIDIIIDLSTPSNFRSGLKKLEDLMFFI